MPPMPVLVAAAETSAAAEWTDDQVVDATIIDDRPRVEYRLLVGAMLGIRPPWMSPDAARNLGRDLAEWLHHCSPVVIVQDGEEWTP